MFSFDPVIPFTVPFGTEASKLLPSIRSLSVAFNPLKSEYVEKMGKEENKKAIFESYQNNGENRKGQQILKPQIIENGPMSRIEKMDISGIDTERTNICMILSQLPNLQVWKPSIFCEV